MNYEGGRVKKKTVPFSRNGPPRRVLPNGVNTCDALLDELEADDDALGARLDA